MSEKRCYTCKEVKPLDEFQRDASNKDGRHGICKICKRSQENARNHEKDEGPWRPHPNARLRGFISPLHTRSRV